MKASVILQGALDKHYVAETSHWESDADKSEYMCSSISHYLTAQGYAINAPETSILYNHVQNTFMPIIESEYTICLTLYLKATDKDYADLVERLGHDSAECFSRRVTWWESHIVSLIERGL